MAGQQYQQLSCREGGQFDHKRQLLGTWRNTRWHDVSTERCKAGISRRLRIKAKKEV